MGRVSQQFGDRVRQVLEEHGLTYRGASNRTGGEIDSSTLWDMAHGKVPTIEKLLQFVRGFGLNANEWLELADYERVWDPDAALVAGIRELQAEFGDFQFSTETLPLQSETPEHIAAALAAIRQRLEERR